MERSVKCVEYDSTSRQKTINELCEKYKFIKKLTIGKSSLGKPITALKIGSASQYALITAAFHGSERITSNVLLMFVEELAYALQNNGYVAGINAERAMRGRGIIFVPCVNPDGCDIALYGKSALGEKAEKYAKLCNNDFENWNANARGVDIKCNFDVGWEKLRQKQRKEGIYGPSKMHFGGFKPESEPETVALTNLCRTADIRHVTALHTQGEVIYWSYSKNQPPKSRKMAEIMSTSSGYALDYPCGITAGGSFKDWFIDEFNRPGFTLEIGKGKNPLPIETAEDIYLKIREMLILCSIM